jgi:hypothetical protein
VDVDDTGGAIAVLRRQRASEHVELARNTRVQDLTESAECFGDEDAVDAVLQVGMIAAHMQLTERVLHEPGCLQQHLVQGRRFALRKVLDILLAESVDGAAGIGRELVACSVELARGTCDGHRVQLDVFGRRVAIGGAGERKDRRRGRSHGAQLDAGHE